MSRPQLSLQPLARPRALRFGMLTVLSAAASLLAAATQAWAAPLNIINVIPQAFSSEVFQQSEPNIGVNPTNANQLLITSFADPNGANSAARSVIWSSNGGGVVGTWGRLEGIVANDLSVDWSASGSAYVARLFVDPNLNQDAIELRETSNPANATSVVATSQYTPGGGKTPDQPWVQAINGTFNFGGAIGNVNLDVVHTTINDLSQSQRTATDRVGIQVPPVASVNIGGYTNEGLDRATTGISDNAPVRTAIHGASKRVYAAFQRINNFPAANPPDFTGDVVVLRDDFYGLPAGFNGPLARPAGSPFMFQNLGAQGTIVGANISIPNSNGAGTAGTTLGRERIGSDVSIAADPSDPTGNTVYLAYAELRGGVSGITVKRSANGGVAWNEVFRTTDTLIGSQAMPALAVAGNGTVGLLFERYDNINNDLDTLLIQAAGGNFANRQTDLIGSFPDMNPPNRDINPYVGDYFDLNAVGNTFYGTYSSSNDPSLNIWRMLIANGNTVSFDRWTSTPGTFTATSELRASNPDIGPGRPVPISIDPFFFRTTALVPEPGSLALLLGMLVAVPLSRRRLGADC